MSFFKKKEKQQSEKASQSNVNLFKDVSDFEFVQKDSSIFDQKFQTKPTTFFKDAMKRFAKNHSSVVAAVILLVIVGMSIIVPLADANNIETAVAISAYLPPKWWGVNDQGFLDGTGNVTNVVIDPATNEPASTGYYEQRAIVNGKITYHDAYYNILSDSVKLYGAGGAVALKVDSTEDAGLLSPSFVYSVANDISINVVFDEKTKDASSYSPNYDVQLLADFDNSSAYASSIELQGYSTNYDPLTLSAIQNTVKTSAAYIAAGKPSAFNACLLFNVKAETNQPSLYIKTISVKAPEDDTTDYSMVAFSDATKMLSGTNPYTIHGSATLNVYGSKVILGDFRYDYYEAAFGKDDYVFDSGMIDDFYKKGYLTTNYPWGAHTTSGDFEPDANFLKNFLTDAGKQYCPLQEITTERITAFRGEITGRSLVGKRSLYRYDYYKGLINKCEYPQYFFGTNSNGQDFFKIVFSGLSTSLLLGLLTAVINFSVGLIWGSISGYFGGWTDIIMERFTEILGGMPWIVMFTLIVLLLGSNFQTFLLALCLTGWMGMAGETREQFYRFKGREYVLASRTLGASDWRLIFRHILPNGIGTIITSAAFMIPGVIFSEASISYLLPSTLAFSGSKSFGVTLSQAQADIHQYPYLIVSASIIMVLLMISFNLFANGLRDAFNPSLKGSDN